MPYCDWEPIVLPESMLELVENWDQLSVMFSIGILLAMSLDIPAEIEKRKPINKVNIYTTACISSFIFSIC